LSIVGILIITVLVNKMLDIVIDRSAIAWSSGHFYSSEDRTRLQLRIPTIARALAAAKAFVLVFIAVLSGFTQVGFPVSSVITIGSVGAIAISLAAQNFVRDFLNGFLVLYEDQYVAGDYITINGLSGSVEVLTLRMVQLRDVGGNLITIPHSSVVTVLNQSRNWSRIDFRIPVDAATDTAHALTLIQTAIDELATKGTWTHSSSSPLEWLGIESLNRDAIVLRASIRTAPLQQFALRRQINDRVRQAFLNADITLGAPPP
jgi:small conductance mechanosensitive channel